jgi:hypothetical protein
MDAMAQRQKFSATVAPMQFQAMLISLFQLYIFPKVSKTVGILAKMHENLFD